MLKRVISGGQTGADRAGLIAAKMLGYQTGGYIPNGYLTENGYEPDLGREFGLVEFGSTYPPRTLANVRNADVTLIFYGGSLERGSALTAKYCEQLGKQYLTIKIDEMQDIDKTAQQIFNWLMAREVAVLNIAGNRESKCPGIQEIVYQLLLRVLDHEEFRS